MERVILHCDANAFYASVECLYTPSIRNCPVAVCGNVEERHGIVLTKNQIAKSYGIQDRLAYLASPPEVSEVSVCSTGLRAVHSVQCKNAPTV